ncbi:hypothetical protein TNCV_4565801 [Trichonephila clavipes]|nr:hypothetical protein TNCV_4565801 [Trichonephila clavipes]
MHYSCMQYVRGLLGQTLRGGRGHHKDSDLNSNPWSETSSFGVGGNKLALPQSFLHQVPNCKSESSTDCTVFGSLLMQTW